MSARKIKIKKLSKRQQEIIGMLSDGWEKAKQ